MAEPEEGNVGVMDQRLGRGTLEGQNGGRLTGVHTVKNLIFPQPQASHFCVSPERGKKKAGVITAGPRFASAKRKENLAGLVFAMIWCSRGCVPDGWSVVSLQRNGDGITAGCVLQWFCVREVCAGRLVARFVTAKRPAHHGCLCFTRVLAMGCRCIGISRRPLMRFMFSSCTKEFCIADVDHSKLSTWNGLLIMWQCGIGLVRKNKANRQC